MAYSSEGIPKNLLKMLQNAEIFEVYFQDTEQHQKQCNFDSDYLEFEANQINKNLSKEFKEDLLSAFFKDVEKGGEASRCWVPHHGIRAVYDNQLIEIAICFWCGWFRGETLGEKFYGTFPGEEESESKIFFDKIFLEQTLENK